MEQKREFTTALATVNDTYMPLIQKQLEGHDVTFSEYAKKCVLNTIASINQMLSNNGIKWNDPQLDQSNLTEILMNVASLELNPVAEPAECFFQLRNVKRKNNGKDEWKKIIELGVQGAGNDAILARFGRDVKKIYPHWLVREDDEFEYPSYVGVEYMPPKWTPKGTGKVVRVVYPILHTDNTIHYYIGERADVARNLLAHVNNNLMNETFGLCKDRYSATPDQLKQINERKAEIKSRVMELGLDAIDDVSVSPYISPSWKEGFSRESMIVRKMQNNVVKKIPKDFRNTFVQENYLTAVDDGYRNAKKDIIEGTAYINVDDFKASDTKNTPKIAAEIDEKDVNRVNGQSEGKTPAEPNYEPVDISERQKPDFD